MAAASNSRVYPWQRERCWLENAEDGSQWEQSRATQTGRHPLLGRHFKLAQPAGTHFWEVTLDKEHLPYLDDHRIEGVAVLPASAYVEMALAAAVEAFGAQSFALRDIEFHRALFLPDGEALSLQLILSPGSGWSSIVSHLQSPSRNRAVQQNMDAACERESSSSTGRRCQRCAPPWSGDARGDPGSMPGRDLWTRLLCEAERKRYPVRLLFPNHYSVVAARRECAG